MGNPFENLKRKVISAVEKVTGPSELESRTNIAQLQMIQSLERYLQHPEQKKEYAQMVLNELGGSLFATITDPEIQEMVDDMRSRAHAVLNGPDQ